ncbi:MAG: ABC transporter substrate-binding protein [Desulfobacteraceae bacterium 4572_35.2]|nr:MAG: ABC transporter substrate-binding protein [Desulfobacteraceae bacterium 4572_35.2]
MGWLFLVKLAWRNIWRQKRRTLITASTIAMTLMLSLFMRSMQEGSYSHNLDNVTRFYSGYLQLQHPQFSDNQSIDKLLPADSKFSKKIHSITGLSHVVPRLESFALGASASSSKGVVVMGISPQLEDVYSGLAAKISQGRYFVTDNENGCVIGSGLAEYLRLELGDQLVLYGQGYHGVTAAGLYPVVGIVHFPVGQFDRRVVYLPLESAQQLFATAEQVSSWVLHFDNINHLDKLKSHAQQVMGAQVRVRDWADLSPELEQQVALDRISGQFLIFVLYGVAGFGLFATIMMMTLERQREFAVMGLVLGMAVITPTLVWFYYHPIPLSGEIAMTMEEMGFEAIIPFSLDPALFVSPIVIVFCLVFVCILYPIGRLQRLAIAAALKGGR